MAEIALCQFDIAWEDKAANYKRVESRVKAAALPPGTLLALPEMFNTGFSMNAGLTAEPIDGPTAQFVKEVAIKHQLYVVAGLVVTGPSGRPRNESLAFSPGGEMIARYAKIHLFSPAPEHVHYEPGNELVQFEWAGARVTLTICYDLRFPELYRLGARRGTDVFINIASWPAMRGEHFPALARARAIENQAFFAALNRCGRDPKFEYKGLSQIIDPRGKALADAGGEDQIIRAEIDLADLKEYRSLLPALRDVRTDLFSGPE